MIGGQKGREGTERESEEWEGKGREGWGRKEKLNSARVWEKLE